MVDSRSRRGGTLVAFVVVLLVVAGVAPGVTAAGTDADQVDADVDAGGEAGWVTAVDDGDATTAPQTADRPTLHQRTVAARNDEPGSVTLTFEYDIPSSVEELRVSVPVTSLSGISVGETDGFERSEQGWFRWDGETESPSFSLRLAVSDSLADGVRGVEREDWALVSEPNSRVQVQAPERPIRTKSFEVAEGEPGHADSHLAFLGEHDRRDVTVADENATFILRGEGADPTQAADFLRTANEHFDLGVQRGRVTVFVLPLREEETADIEAATVDTAFWIGTSGLALDGTGSVFAHEYVHTRLGPTGRDDATWLTEATAEYYGRVFSLNDGVGSYDAFLDGLRATEYAPDRRAVVLADGETWRGTTAHYTKGAHVLAALDAQIQRRTGGERSLRDVFEGRSEPFEDYEAFRAAVIETSGDEDLGPWLDRYVTTDDLPPLPENPRYYVAASSVDSDGDGMANGAELDANRHPFVEGEGPTVTTVTSVDDGTTPTATDGATATATATQAPTGTTDSDAPGFGFGVFVAAVATLLVGVRVGVRS
ncbi:hypothetical protein [Haloplanus salilacus]|uniref:hypothetical protein n=1 Tax=Haloplanus salilacus TaxID=2949994 RepID=UPI0030CCA589